MKQEEPSENASSKDGKLSIYDVADDVLRTILRKQPDIKVIISSKEGKCVTSTLCMKQALEQSGCVLNFTDKARVLIRKLLNEDLNFVRIKGRTNEIVVVFDEFLDIITIQEDKMGK